MGGSGRINLKDLTIKSLLPINARMISDLIVDDRPEYRRHFTPFAFDEKSISEMLGKAVADRYWGFWSGDRLCGLFMLRGFDKGFERPTFGVYIRECFSNRGLGQLALRHALSWCRINEIPAVMLKVQPTNKSAIRVYQKAGFESIGQCQKTHQQILEKRWVHP